MTTGMTRIVPPPESIRHVRDFTRAELIDALKQFLTSRGVSVPDGNAYVMGMETPYHQIDGDEFEKPCVTLIIDEPPINP